ncbi:hypothetical protein JYT29_00790 [Nitrospina gracilis]|nr:hypothetical protein [Nitrospina gracilis]
MTLDLFHCKVIGWGSLDNPLITNEGIEYGNSKRGVPYVSNEFQALLETNGVQCSMVTIGIMLWQTVSSTP